MWHVNCNPVVQFELIKSKYFLCRKIILNGFHKKGLYINNVSGGNLTPRGPN